MWIDIPLGKTTTFELGLVGLFDLVTMLFVTGSDGLVLVVAEKENQIF
jgi:hypothetical protein